MQDGAGQIGRSSVIERMNGSSLVILGVQLVGPCLTLPSLVQRTTGSMHQRPDTVRLSTVRIQTDGLATVGKRPIMLA